MPIVVDLLVRKKETEILGDAGRLDLSVGDRVLVDIEQGLEIGLVNSKERLIEKKKGEIYKIVRKLTEEDLPRIEENKKKGMEATKTVLQKIEDCELDMKLTYTEYNFDRTKLFIYYTSDTRVDFRQLIKDLGHVLKTKIQMVQIGVRDETKMLGGIGPCGRVLCCKSFLKNFVSVSVESAKQQDVSFNIAKLSGLCGRLMCCLSYESDFYNEQFKKLPRIGSKVHTPEGPGSVLSVNCIKEEVTVELGDKQVRKFPFSKISSSLLEIIKEKASLKKKR
ncbi:MAG: hypothetical protein AUJ85_06995 [Elusimicrobia bacterium CG1_02_37_114]|nr:MAG: hypothetical protein AUJ85_06995 [Elusimicrobia bacterium CG1_02_37_114]PIZ12444.1 MAG: stage 0 sporulation protein [Elusimicrobia bacterium CG_4_10_14_0_8_um_filter_37_32]